MSWLSEGLAAVGISKDTQRAITKPLLAAAAPFTGGASAALIPFANRGRTATPGQSAIEQSFAAAAGQMIAASPYAAAQAAAPGLWEKIKVPTLVAGSAIGIGLFGYLALRR